MSDVAPESRRGGPQTSLDERVPWDAPSPRESNGSGPDQVRPALDTGLIEMGVMLTRTIAQQAEAERAADLAGFREGYRLGFQAGWDVGYGRAHHEIAEQHRRAAERLVKACLTNWAREGRDAPLFRGQVTESMIDALTSRILEMLGSEA